MFLGRSQLRPGACSRFLLIAAVLLLLFLMPHCICSWKCNLIWWYQFNISLKFLITKKPITVLAPTRQTLTRVPPVSYCQTILSVLKQFYCKGTFHILGYFQESNDIIDNPASCFHSPLPPSCFKLVLDFSIQF